MPTLRQVTAGLFLLALGGVSGWVLTISQRVSVVETRQDGAIDRLEALESGRTTPMSAEARATFVAVRSEIAQFRASVETDIRTLREGQSEMMRYLLKSNREKGDIDSTPGEEPMATPNLLPKGG